MKIRHLPKWVIVVSLVLACACGSTTAPSDSAVDGQTDALEVLVDASPDTIHSDAAGDAPDLDSSMPCSTWCSERALPTPLQELAAVRLGERIVIAGGFENAATPVARVRAYSPAADWLELPSLPDTRHHIGLAAHEGDLYVLGGMRGTSFEPIARSYVLRSGADAWEEIAPMPVPRAAGFAASVGGTIVVAGGQGEGRSATERLDAAADVLVYDPESDSWTRGAPIPVPREHVAGVSYEGQVWIFGGRPLALEPTSDRVDIYDVALNAWSEGPVMPSPRGGFAAAEREGTVVVTGGEERSGALASSDLLDLRTRTWVEGPDMMSARHGHGMAALGDSLFAIGGADRPIFSPIDGVERITP